MLVAALDIQQQAALAILINTAEAPRQSTVGQYPTDGRAVLPKLSVKAFHDGKEIGQCKSESAGECCDAKEAQDWVFIAWLGINENDQKKGLGRYLLQRNLWEMSKIGYKNSVISTDWNNFRALLFYTNYGYKVVDTMHEFVKNIE